MISLKTNDWELNNIEAILFDKDGTFIDSHIYWGKIIELRINAVMKYYNIDKNLFNKLCLSLGYDRNKKCLIPKGPIALLAREAVINSLVEELKKQNIEAQTTIIEEIFKDVHKEFLPQIYDYIKLIDDAKDLFDRLKKTNVKMAVVTSDTKANTEAILEYLGLKKYFSLVIGKDDCTKAKKTGEPALIALEKLGVCANKTISVGDAPMDYEMAKNAGLKGSILVSSGQIPLEGLKKLTNTCVLSLKELRVDND